MQNIESNQNEITNDEEILRMLMPNQLQRPAMDFIEVEEIQRVLPTCAPKTQDQVDRENYEEVVERDKNEVYVTEEQKKKTIKCLLKCLDY